MFYAKYLLLHGKDHGISLCRLEGSPQIKFKDDLIKNHGYPSKDANQRTQYYFVFKIKGKGIQRKILEEHGFYIEQLCEKLGVDTTIARQNNHTLRPHTATLPQVLDCLAVPVSREELES